MGRAVALTLEATLMLGVTALAISSILMLIYYGLHVEEGLHYSKVCADSLIASIIAGLEKMKSIDQGVVEQVIQEAVGRVKSIGCTPYYVKATLYKYNFSSREWTKNATIEVGEKALRNTLYPKVKTIIYLPSWERDEDKYTTVYIEVEVIAFKRG